MMILDNFTFKMSLCSISKECFAQTSEFRIRNKTKIYVCNYPLHLADNHSVRQSYLCLCSLVALSVTVRGLALLATTATRKFSSVLLTPASMERLVWMGSISTRATAGKVLHHSGHQLYTCYKPLLKHPSSHI